MHAFWSFDSLISLLTLIVLEIVLGIDNVIFVSIFIGRLPSNQLGSARRQCHREPTEGRHPRL
jgi:predicted tellurium resistance membrane protein TerC